MVTGPFNLSEFGVDYCICRDVGVLGLSATTSVLWHRQGGRGSVAGPVLGPPEDGWITVERPSVPTMLRQSPGPSSL